jgi:outer membrane immunogenic protein
MKRLVLALLALLPASAFAQSAVVNPGLTIPVEPIDPNPTPSIWNGLYVGGGVSVWGGKGQKGGVGGDVFAGYDHEFKNNLVLGVKLDTGYAPFTSMSGRFRGFDYTVGTVKLGYDFGKVTPFVYAGGGIARATNFASGPDAGATLNGAFGSGPGFGVTTFGAGVDYHVTNNVTLSVSGGVMKGNGPASGF